MATAKKAAKKAKSTKKVVVKKAKRGNKPVVVAASAGVPAAAPLHVANETFSTNREAETVPSGKVQVFVNGTNKGTADVKGRKLGEFVTEIAEKQGVRNFTVYVDGSKIMTNAISAALDDPQHPVGKIEIVAKDSRA